MMNSPAPGQMLGKYRLETEIGRGGMGIVYRAYDPVLKRRVAIKVLPPELTYDKEFVARFQQEAILAAQLRHPGIVTIHDVGQEGDTHYIVMEYLEGETLEAWARRHGSGIRVEDALGIVRQVAAALDHAHSRGVVHRDVKPANIMLGADGRVTVMDFGLVRAAEGTHLTRTGMVMGTPEYMSPEQGLGEVADARSDIYSLGVVLYLLLSGKVPFSRSTPYATTYAHINEPPPPLRQVRPDLSPQVEAVVNRALAKRREDRYQRAGELADALADAPGAVATSRRDTIPNRATRSAAETEIIAPAERAPDARAPTRSPRNQGRVPWAWILALVGLALVVAVVAVVVRPGWQGPKAAAAPTAPAADPATAAAGAVDVGGPIALASSTLAPPTAPAAAVTRPATTLVRSTAALPTPVPATQPPPTPPQGPPRLTARSVVNVRSGPGTAYQRIGSLSAGQNADIIGRNAAGDWWQVAMDGQPGWVTASLVDVVADPAAVVPVVVVPPPTSPPEPTPTSKTLPCAFSPGPSFARFWDRSRMGCATSLEQKVWSAYEPFQRGWMLWRKDNDLLYAFFSGGYRTFRYPSADPPEYWCTDAQAAGNPRRGFSRVWCDNPEVRNAVGAALAMETGEDRPIQEYESGFMVYISERTGYGGGSMWVDRQGAWAERR